MANDIDMWDDLESMNKKTQEYQYLWRAYMAKFIDNDEKMAKKFKKAFIKKFKYWSNYY